MKRIDSNHPHRKSPATGLAAPIIAPILLSSLLSAPLLAEGRDDYFENALLPPSQAILLAEARGRVTIYDGLEESTIERALDQQFSRIERMMFVNTRRALPDGSEEIDDDC